MSEQDRLAALRAENARLVALLEAHGIEWRLPPETHRLQTAEPPPSAMSTSDKVALFRRLFQGRTDPNEYPRVTPGGWDLPSSAIPAPAPRS